MAWTRNAWNNFKAQPEIWFFYGFILTSPLSIRKVFLNYPILGEFNEYSGTYLYLSDIFLGLAIGAWLIFILYNNYSNLSISKPFAVSPQKESSTWNFLRGRRGTKVTILGLPVFLVIWSFITINWSDHPQIATFRSFKLFEFYLLYLFLAFNSKCSTPVRMFPVEHPTRQAWNILRNAFRIIIAIGLINAIIGILQIVLQHSVGLFWLKESLISPDLPGVAKIVLNGGKYIRAYALFPHPNILGGFLLLSIILTLVYRQIFYSAENNSRLPRENRMFHGEHSRFLHSGVFFPLILGIQIVGGILTASKSAILGLILALVYIYRHQIAKMFHPSRNVPRGTSYGANAKYSSLPLSKIIKRVFFLAIIASIAIYLIHTNFGSIFIKSLAERLTYIRISLDMISNNFLAGIGSGQFVLEMQRYSQEALLAWQFQPVHNVFLLIWAELGLIGLSLFGWFLWELFHPSQNVPRLPREATLFHVEQSSFLRGGIFGSESSVQSVFKALLIGFFVIALFDHYLWDIQQGQIILWTALGLLAGTKLRS